MVENKKEHLKQSDFSKVIYKSLFKEILFKSFSVASIVVFVLSFSVNYCLETFVGLFYNISQFKFYFLIVLISSSSVGAFK